MQYKSSVRVFKSDFLEKFTHVHPIIPLLVWGPVVLSCSYVSLIINLIPPSVFLVVGLVGFFSWTLAEYLLHRYLFHFERDTPLGRRMHFLLHGIHHEDPQDPTRLVMPPLLAIPIGASLFLIFRTVLGPVWTYPFYAFFIFGYLCYDYMHYAHHHFSPRSRVGIRLKKNHMNHHYVETDAFWGVSSPIWDYVFGTAGSTKPPKKVEPISRGSARTGRADPIV